ncbi:RHS repeat protein [Vibrio navarrensis]
MTNITSNAYNFSEFISSGVDPRTGTYSFSINLGEFISHKNSGDRFNLHLNYNAGSSLDMGFSRGWSVAISQFDRDNNTLSLTTGQNFKIQWNNAIEEYDIPYRKLKDIRVFYLDTTEEIKVVHKDGRQEFIDYYKGTLTRLVSPQGLSVYFEYGNFINLRQTLWRVYDESGREIIIDWWSDEWKTTIQHKLDGELYQELVLDKTGNGGEKRLSYITLPGQHDFITIEYRFLNSGFDLIEKVTHLTGLEERLSYRDEGHSLPDNAPVESFPYVTQHLLLPGENQPQQITTYHYSDKNYLGFGSDRNWIAGEDTLFKARQDYRYSSTEIVNGIKSVKRTYNKYHLLENAEYYHVDTLYKREDNVYFANLSLGIESQPPIYSYVKESHTTHYFDGAERTFSIRFNYDDYGNQIYAQDVDGSETVRAFYPANGEGDNCPASPSGIVSFLKRESFIPAIDTSGEMPRHVDMLYRALPRIDDTSQYFVVLRRQTYHDHRIDIEHYSDTTAMFEHGRVMNETLTVNQYQTQTSYQYDFAKDGLKTTITLTGYDGLQAETSSVQRYSDGQIAESTNTEGIKTVITYDAQGRKLTETFAPGSEYETTLTYQYQTGSGNNSISVKDPKGNHVVHHFNNAGKIVDKQISDAEGVMRTVETYLYDAFGLLLTQEDIDWVGNTSATLTSSYEYNMAGEVSKINHSDGLVECFTHNPVTLTNDYEISGLVKEITVFNESELEIEKRTLDASNQSLAHTQYQYDGYSNLIRVTDTGGHVTEHVYDASDRLIETSRTIDGQVTKHTIQYADFSIDELTTQVAVDDVVLGQRRYDGLARLVMESAGGAEKNFTYGGPSSLPSSERTANGDTIVYNNDPYLQVADSITVPTDPNLACMYAYDKQTGGMESSLNQGAKTTHHRNRLGQLTAMSVELNEGTTRTASFQYSLQGRLLAKTDYFAQTSEYHYDAFRRLTRVTSSDGSQTTITYDGFSRATAFETTHQGDTVVISLTFNELGLETQRDVTLNGALLFTLSQSFNRDMQIEEKVYEDSAGITVETMTYDDLHRLTEYTCMGTAMPQDEHGHAIAKQRFGYDTYGNIQWVESDFADGTNNRASYVYFAANPVQLQSLSNTHSDYPEHIEFLYDKAGNLLQDEEHRTYQYNALGQMDRVAAEGKPLSTYRYDGLGNVVAQTEQSEWIYLYYLGSQLANELCAGVHSHHHKVPGAASSRSVVSGGSELNQLLVPDAQGTIRSTLTKSQTEAEREQQPRHYTVYGEG